MSLQAYLRGHIDEAVDTVEGASERARHVGAPRVLAFATMAGAHAYGRAGDARAASAAIACAERLLESIGPHTRDPAWISYFTIERIASDSCEIFRDLRQPKAALRWSVQAAPMPEHAHTRSVGLRTAVEATAFLQLRDLDQGLARADRALGILGRVTSARGHDYLRTVADALRPWSPRWPTFSTGPQPSSLRGDPLPALHGRCPSQAVSFRPARVVRLSPEGRSGL
jgi:hypothetical protein